MLGLRHAAQYDWEAGCLEQEQETFLCILNRDYVSHRGSEIPLHLPCGAGDPERLHSGAPPLSAGKRTQSRPLLRVGGNNMLIRDQAYNLHPDYLLPFAVMHAIRPCCLCYWAWVALC